MKNAGEGSKPLAAYRWLILDELGFVPLFKVGAALLLEVFGPRYGQGSILVTNNPPFDEWPELFGSERLTYALLDRLTHRVHGLEMNGGRYRLLPPEDGRLARYESTHRAHRPESQANPSSSPAREVSAPPGLQRRLASFLTRAV